MVTYHGWQVAGLFTSPGGEVAQVKESVGVADVSWILKFDINGPGLEHPPALGQQASLWNIGRLHGLLTCEPTAGDAVKERLREMQDVPTDCPLPPPVYVTEVTSVYAQLWLVGPRSRAVLNKLTPLNLSDSSLSDLSCAQTSIAHVRAIVLRKDLKGLLAYHLLVGREYGESVWESVLHAGHEFHIAPFGLQAQQLLQS